MHDAFFLLSFSNYTDNTGDTCKVAIDAGVDLDDGVFYANLPSALAEGKIKCTFSLLSSSDL